MDMCPEYFEDEEMVKKLKNNNLLPCPFCGEIAILCSHTDDGKAPFSVRCKNYHSNSWRATIQ